MERKTEVEIILPRSRLSWPSPEAYEQWQQETISPWEAREFTSCLFRLAKWFAFELFSDLKPEDREEIVNYAVYKHAKDFCRGNGSGKSHLLKVVKTTGIDLKRKKALTSKENSIESLARVSGYENEYDFMDQFIDYERHKETIKSNDDLLFIDHLFHNREKLSSYPWKNTFFLYLEFVLSGDDVGVNEFCDIARDSYGLNASESTIYRHIKEGIEQFKKWIILGEDSIFFEKILRESRKELGK